MKKTIITVFGKDYAVLSRAVKHVAALLCCKTQHDNLVLSDGSRIDFVVEDIYESDAKPPMIKSLASFKKELRFMPKPKKLLKNKKKQRNIEEERVTSLLNLKVSERDKRALNAAAKKYSDGNLSAWLRDAGKRYVPAKAR